MNKGELAIFEGLGDGNESPPAQERTSQRDDVTNDVYSKHNLSASP